MTSSPAPVRAASAGKALVATGTASTAYGQQVDGLGVGVDGERAEVAGLLGQPHRDQHGRLLGDQGDDPGAARGRRSGGRPRAGIRSAGRQRQPVRIAGTTSGTDSTTTPSVVPQPSTRIASSLTSDGATCAVDDRAVPEVGHQHDDRGGQRRQRGREEAPVGLEQAGEDDAQRRRAAPAPRRSAAAWPPPRAARGSLVHDQPRRDRRGRAARAAAPAARARAGSRTSSTDAVWSARSRSPAPSRWAMSGTATAARMPPAATSNSTFGMALTLW